GKFLLAFRIAENRMRREKLLSSKSGRSAIVDALLQALSIRDFITAGHAERLEKLAVALGKEAGLPEQRIADLRLFACLHDLGKLGVPDAILLKPGPLSPEEKTEIEKHSEYGYRIAVTIPELFPIADWILKHHERWDGKGYPLGLKQEEIPLECRILSIADAFDAMTSSRPYREPVSKAEALAELLRCAGTQFDPRLVRIFINIIQNALP
ncbi:MAG: HD-GYP domain-containing protein, partial [Desulfotomaculales bacterium]